VDWLNSKSESIAKFFESNPEKDSVLINIDLVFPKLEDKDFLENIREDNPTLFPKNFKMNSFKMKLIKKGNELKTEYYLINNVKYIPVDLTKSLKVKKK
jgi:hypothetical protein